MQVNKICGRLLIVTDEVAHQNVEDVIVDWNNFPESRHDFV